MPIPSRSCWALAAGLLGVVTLVGPVRGQGEAASPANGARPATTPALRIGAIDMEKVFKEYQKVTFTSEQLKADATAKQAELTKLLSEMKRLGEEMSALDPGSNDFKAKESEATKLKAQLEAEREQAQADFARREAEALASIYTEIQEASAAVAKANNMQYIVKVSTEPVSGNDPNSVMAAMARSIVYSDPSLDITSVVVRYLNQRYEASGGQAPADPAAQPASATRPAAPAASAAAAPTGR